MNDRPDRPDAVAALEQTLKTHNYQKKAQTRPSIADLIERLQACAQELGDVATELKAFSEGGNAELKIATDELMKIMNRINR